jgi:hypothetical protein
MCLLEFLTLGLIFWIVPKIFKLFNIKIRPLIIVRMTFLIIGSIILFVAYMFIFIQPSSIFLKGKGIPLIPVFVGLSSLLFAVFLFFRKKPAIIDNDISKPMPSFWSWFLYAIAGLLIMLSKYLFLFSIYSPSILKSDAQIPHIGVGIFLAGLFVAVLVLYGFERFTNKKSPKISFELSYFLIIFGFYLVTVYSLLLVYGLYEKYHVSYLFWGNIMVLGYLPLLLLLFIITLKNGSITQQNSITK